MQMGAPAARRPRWRLGMRPPSGSGALFPTVAGSSGTTPTTTMRERAGTNHTSWPCRVPCPVPPQHFDQGRRRAAWHQAGPGGAGQGPGRAGHRRGRGQPGRAGTAGEGGGERGKRGWLGRRRYPGSSSTCAGAGHACSALWVAAHGPGRHGATPPTPSPPPTPLLLALPPPPADPPSPPQAGVRKGQRMVAISDPVR